MSQLFSPNHVENQRVFWYVPRSLSRIGYRVTYPLIGVVIVLMTALILSDPVWVWINNDEEEDTVRFRQRLSYTVFWIVVVGLVHVRNTFTYKPV